MINLKDISITGKLYVIFGGILSVVVFAFLMIFIFSLHVEKSVNDMDVIKSKYLKILDLYEDMNETHGFMKSFLLSGDVHLRDSYQRGFSQTVKLSQEVLASLASQESGEMYLKYVEPMVEKFQKWEKDVSSVQIDKSKSPYTFDVARLLETSPENFEIWKNIQADFTELDEMLSAQLKDKAQAQISSLSMMNMTTILVAIVLLGACVLGIVICRRVILKPILELSEEFKALAQYDLTRQIQVKSKDEIGGMCGEFNHFVSRLREMVTAVGGASSQMATASEEMSINMKEMVEMGAGQTEAASQISIAVQDSSQKAQEITEISTSTRNNVQSIATSAENANDCMTDLEGNSKRIVGVLSVIRDIADQVNLLALNAAIEAARAGDAGRGFAVVADEVRKLAGHTSESTEEIDVAIQELQGNVEKTGAALFQITGAIGSISNEMEQVTGSLTHQSAAIEEISSTVDNFSHQVKRMDGAMSEFEAVANSISKEAASLDEQVSFFKK